MARRIVMGRMSNGSYDVRMSRRGSDAYTGNVNNARVISFSAQRAARAKVGAAGIVSSLSTWVSFGQTFDYPPPTLAALKRGGQVRFNYFNYLPVPGASNANFYGTPFCMIVSANSIKAIQVILWGNFALQSGDRFLYYTLSQD